MSEIHYGLTQSQYLAVCVAVQSERAALYVEHEHRYGKGQYPTVAEVNERAERARETLIGAFKRINAAKPLWTVPLSADDAFCMPRDAAR
jgi:hypothetical protein